MERDRETEPPAERQPYEAPKVISEEVFETLALTCGKVDTFECQISGGPNS